MGVFTEWRPGWGGKRGRLRGYTLDAGTALAEVAADYALTPSQVLSATLPIPLANLRTLAMRSDGRVKLERGTAGTPEIQTVAIGGGTPTTGSFRLAWGGLQSNVIQWNDNAAAVQAAVEASGAIGVGNVACTGGPLPGSTVTMTFAASLGNLPAPLVGGVSPLDAGSVVVTTIQNGAAGSTTNPVTLYGWPIPLLWTSDYSSLLPCPWTADVANLVLTNLSSTRNARVQIRARYES